jgi:hypothetical protein
MNVKQLFLLSTLCLTMGSTTQAPAQGFLNKLKNKGAKLVKKAMPNPVKDVVKTVEDTEGAASRTRTRVENKVRNRTSGASTRLQNSGSVTLSPKKKEMTIKLCRALLIARTLFFLQFIVSTVCNELSFLYIVFSL